MAATNLPADLPEDWQQGQIVSPNGTDVGLTKQHGYNYMAEQINDTQEAVNAHTADTTNPHKTTAEQIRALYDYWFIDTNLETWALQQSKSGHFVVDTSAMGITPIGFFAGSLTVNGDERYISLFDAAGKYWFRGTVGGVWNSAYPWHELANAANYLPLDGSVAMTGTRLMIWNDKLRLDVDDIQFGMTVLNTAGVETIGRKTRVLNSKGSSLQNCFVLDDLNGSNTKMYNIFGEHNPQLLAATIQNLIQGGSISMIKSVQRGIITIAASATEGTATLAQAVNMSKAVVIFGGSIFGGGNSNYSSYYWDARLVLSANNKVNAARAYSPSYTAIVPYQVLEFA